MLKEAGIEPTSMGGGVSTAVRKYWRAYYKQKNVPSMLGDNKIVNEIIYGDAAKATPMHRFLLKSGEVAEIRKSSVFYYVIVYRSGASRIDVIAIQPSFKAAPPEISKSRMTPEWLQKDHKKR